MKLPQPEINVPEEKGAKKAPPAAKKGGAPTDELKPVFGRAWVDLSDL